MTRIPSQIWRRLFATALLIITVSGNAQQTENPSTQKMAKLGMP